MSKIKKYMKSKKNTETYVRLSDVHREFGEWLKIYDTELTGLNPISKKYFHYFINLLPSVELNEEYLVEIEE